MADSLYVDDAYVEPEYYLVNILVTWGESLIFVPKSAMTLIQSVPTAIYNLDLNEFRLQLRDLEDAAEGMPFSPTHSHNTTVTVGGVTLARVIEILEPYTVTFEDDQYAVNLNGANSNVGDRVNVNQVSVRSANSAGLQDLSTLLSSAYQGMVVVDSVRGQAGATTPLGTFKTPSSNMSDALTIAEANGISTFMFNTNTTLTEDLSGGYKIQGRSPLLTVIADPSANLNGVEVEYLTIAGEMDGLNVITNSRIGAVTNISGLVEKCLLTSTMTISDDIAIMESYSNFEGVGYPTLHILSGSTIVRDFHGSIGVGTCTSGVHSIGVDNGGKVVLEAGCTGGTIHVRGTPFAVEDNSTGTTVIIETEGEKISAMPSSVWNHTQ